MLQSESERIALHVTSRVVGVSLRSTTDLVGTAFGQSWVDQMRSEPDVTLRTSESGATSNVQAGVAFVFSCIANVTALPACAWSLMLGATTMSSTEQGPLGSGSAVAVGLLPALLPAVGLWVAVGLLLSVGAVPTGAGVGTAEVLAEVGEDDTSAPTGRADGPLPPPPPPMKWATPKTSANATATSTSRLVQ